MKRPALSLLLAAVLILTGSVMAGVQAQAVARFFPETGHNVRGPFLNFFDSHGGVATIGYPITEDFIDPRTHLLVQYFQNARMEWHPENPDPYKVQLGLLGDELGKGQPRLAPDDVPAPNNPDCHYFPETGHSVCFAFLGYFKSAGGLDVFGYPISEFDVENGRIVQYFQRARMEWHPERRPGQKVTVGPLGLMHFEFAKLNPDLLNHVQPITAGRERVTELRLSASVAWPVTGARDNQTVFLVVHDQYGQPVEGAFATLTVSYPSRQETHTLPPTSARGITIMGFDVAGGEPGKIVLLDFTVTAAGLTRTTSTSFMIWW